MLRVVLLFILFFIYDVASHGRLEEPPNRSYMWRVLDDPAIAPYQDIVEPNFDDNQLYCGGFQHQQSLGGKCGICGDPWDGVRENEAGGKYGKGIIVRQYSQGALMDVTVSLSAHHMGFFEFRLCEWNNPTFPATHDCLNQNVLRFQDGNTQYYPEKRGSTPWVFNMKVQLPHHITCSQCVLQWRYHAGNTWDCDENNECCTGCGPQEEFYGCADIAIGTGPTNPPPGWNEPPPVTTDPPKSTTKPPQGTEQSTTTPSKTTAMDSSTTSTAAPTTTTRSYPPITSTASTTTPPPNSNKPQNDKPTCENKPQGEYKDDCESFYTCGKNGQGPYLYACPPGTVYDEYREICDYDYAVPPPCGTKE